MKSIFLILVMLSTLAFTNDHEISNNDEALYNRPIIYEHAAFNRNDPGGGEVSIGCTEFNLRNVGWGDKISSIYIPSGQGWEVEIFDASHFRGKTMKTRKSIVNLDKYFMNDMVSSIRVYKRGVLQGDCIWW